MERVGADACEQPMKAGEDAWPIATQVPIALGDARSATVQLRTTVDGDSWQPFCVAVDGRELLVLRTAKVAPPPSAWDIAKEG